MPWGKVKPEGAYLPAFREALDVLMGLEDGATVPLFVVEDLKKARRVCREGSTWFRAYGQRDAGTMKMQFFVERDEAIRPWVMARRRPAFSPDDIYLLEGAVEAGFTRSLA